MTTSAIDARHISKRYGEFTAVDAVDIDVGSGAFWGLLGPNGAGKTTFLRMVIGNTPPTAGDLRVLGYPVPAEATRMRRRIGVVPQKDNLDPDFTVAENLFTYAGYFGLSGSELEQRVRELLIFAALDKRRDAHIGTLSGGMLRRLSLVRALINEPELLILDEPTTGLDPQARQLIWQRLRALRSRGMTLVLTTHYMEEAQRLCDRITIMDHGRILETGAPQELIKHHVEPHVLEVFGPGVDDWHRDVASGLAQRSEQVGESMFYYTSNEQALLAAVNRESTLSCLHRPANLEDVFMRLTGRELRDGQ